MSALVTQWFYNSNPIHIGFYERDYGYGCDWWDGAEWRYRSADGWPSINQRKPWRGLASQPDEMRKQSEAKKLQGYVPKAIPSTCMHCAHYTSKFTDRIGYDEEIYRDESDIKCGVGGFAIKKIGTCKEWVGQPDTTESEK